ncbi:MAG: hypothetical protein K2X06_09115 [Burkholderiales bacterium]|nr:hypothetical protein [Burkholderiales bacterium]
MMDNTRGFPEKGYESKPSRNTKSGVTVAAMRRLGKLGGATKGAKPLSHNTFFRLSTIAVDKPVHTL